MIFDDMINAGDDVGEVVDVDIDGDDGDGEYLYGVKP